MASMPSREKPHPAARCSPELLRLSLDPPIHEAIGYFLGHGRSYPPEILDDELLLILKAYIDKMGTKATADFFKNILPHRQRAECRAVLMNLSRMKREHGGHYPWEA